MGSIYRNSFCNLSAAGLREPQSGLFAPRTSNQSAPVVVSPRPELWTDGDETLIKSESHYLCIPQEFFKRTIELAPVNDRVWVMQERLLSPRKIFFSEHQIFWQCREKKACEMFPDEIPDDPHDIKPRLLGRSFEIHSDFLLCVMDTVIHRQQNGLSASLSNEADKVRLLAAWRGLQNQYVSYGITYASDRLVAINGISRCFEQALGDECVFELRRNQMPFQLIFLYKEKNNSSEQDHSNKNPEIPSWSWAFHEHAMQMTPEVADSQNDHMGEGWEKEALMTMFDITFNEKMTLPPKSGGELHTEQWPACLHLLCHLFPCMPTDDEECENMDENAHGNKRVKVAVFTGGMATNVVIKFDCKVSENVSIMPVFWYKQKMGWALVVSRVGEEDSRIFRRTGIIGATASFWNLFERYWRVCGDEQDTICLV